MAKSVRWAITRLNFQVNLKNTRGVLDTNYPKCQFDPSWTFQHPCWRDRMEGWGWKYLGMMHNILENTYIKVWYWWSWCQDQTVQDQDQRSKITVNYLDRTKDRDQWQRSWRSRSKIDDLPHLCSEHYWLLLTYEDRLGISRGLSKNSKNSKIASTTTIAFVKL